MMNLLHHITKRILNLDEGFSNKKSWDLVSHLKIKNSQTEVRSNKYIYWKNGVSNPQAFLILF
jgi:hypothetical protein